MKAIAVYTICNTMGIEMYEINDEEARVAGFCGDRKYPERTERVYYDAEGRPFISFDGGACYLDEFMRV